MKARSEKQESRRKYFSVNGAQDSVSGQIYRSQPCRKDFAIRKRIACQPCKTIDTNLGGFCVARGFRSLAAVLNEIFPK